MANPDTPTPEAPTKTDVPRVRAFLRSRQSSPEVHGFNGGEVAVFSTRSPAKETPNEDSAAIIPYDTSSGALVVADGVGGSQGGDVASRIAVQALVKSIGAAAREGNPLRSGILDGVEHANHEILDSGTGAATTLAIAQVEGRIIRPFHVGDSMILVTGQRGRVKLQTISHSPVGYAIESGLLDEDEAVDHEDRHLVSNVVGMTNMRVEVGSRLELAARDTLLLATDGLFDNYLVGDIVDWVRKGSLELQTRLMAEECVRRMANPDEEHPSKPDDLTFVVYRPGPASAISSE